MLSIIFEFFFNAILLIVDFFGMIYRFIFPKKESDNLNNEIDYDELDDFWGDKNGKIKRNENEDN